MANKGQKVIEASSNGIRYTDKVIKQMDNASDLNHAFPAIIDTFFNKGSSQLIKGGDGVTRKIIRIHGSINNTEGFFEYIIEPNGLCNHRFFKELR